MHAVSSGRAVAGMALPCLLGRLALLACLSPSAACQASSYCAHMCAHAVHCARALRVDVKMAWSGDGTTLSQLFAPPAGGPSALHCWQPLSPISGGTSAPLPGGPCAPLPPPGEGAPPPADGPFCPHLTVLATPPDCWRPIPTAGGPYPIKSKSRNACM
eukprot:246434-Chlamydomonas_euryale.AAC.2